MSFPPDVVGVIAGYVRQATTDQLNLMLVSNTWYRGVIEQDGMKSKPSIQWPWCALKERQPRSVCLRDECEEEDLEKLIESLPTLTTIRFEDSDITDDGLKLITTQLQSTLTSLNLGGCWDLLEESLDHIMAKGDNLVLLDVSCFGDGEVEFQPAFFASLKHVRTFSFSGSTLQHIGEYMKALTSLDLTHCADLANDALCELSTQLGGQLQHLRLPDTNRVNDDTVKHISQHNTELVSLHLGDCRKVSNEGLKSISMSPLSRQLTTLTINLTCDVTDEGMSCLKTLGSLTLLDLTECIYITEDGFKHVADLPQLTHLNVSYCQGFDDAALAHVGRGVAPLTTLRMVRTAVTDEGVPHLAKKAPTLTELNMDTTYYLTDTSLEWIADNLKMLTYLNVGSCGKVTSTGIRSLSRLRSLDELYAVGWDGATEADAHELSVIFEERNLREFHVI